MTRTAWGAVFILASGLFYSMERLHFVDADLFDNPFVGLFLIVGLLLIIPGFLAGVGARIQRFLRSLEEQPLKVQPKDEVDG